MVVILLMLTAMVVVMMGVVVEATVTKSCALVIMSITVKMTVGWVILTFTTEELAAPKEAL